MNRVAPLRKLRNELRRGNVALRKAWKTPRASFPLFPQGLEIRLRAAGSPHFHRAGGRIKFTRKKGRKDEEKTEFQLTDPITSSSIRTPASLRSENDQLHLGTSDRDHIGITNHLHRNTHSSVSIGLKGRQNHHRSGDPPSTASSAETR